MSDQEPDPDEAPITATPEPESEPGAGESGAFADTASGAAPAQFTAGQWEQPEMPTNVGKSTKGRGRSRAAWAVGLGLGYVILATGTAFGVIIDKTPTAVDVTAVNASAYAAQAGAGSRGSASAHASGKAKPKASASPSTAPTSASPTPTPTPTVTGSVSDGIHSGDLRYFLLPPPQGASSVQGDPNGTTETIDDVLAAYDDASTARSNLEQLDFKTACTRTYQDSTMGANVTIELMQFGSSAESQEWFSDFEFSGGGYQSISVSGESGAEGWSYADNGTYELIGAYREGDTFYEVTIFSSQLIPAPDLGQVVSAEHARLANG